MFNACLICAHFSSAYITPQVRYPHFKIQLLKSCFKHFWIIFLYSISVQIHFFLYPLTPSSNMHCTTSLLERLFIQQTLQQSSNIFKTMWGLRLERRIFGASCNPLTTSLWKVFQAVPLLYPLPGIAGVNHAGPKFYYSLLFYSFLLIYMHSTIISCLPRNKTWTGNWIKRLMVWNFSTPCLHVVAAMPYFSNWIIKTNTPLKYPGRKVFKPR